MYDLENDLVMGIIKFMAILLILFISMVVGSFPIRYMKIK